MLDEFDWLGMAIDADAGAGRFGLWGASTVIDENLGAPVISRELFDALHARAGIAARWPVGNAGVLHVYGYLLSRVVTPYGLKRDRWVGGRLAEAFGLDREAFLPWSGEGTLLSRVSAAATAPGIPAAHRRHGDRAALTMYRATGSSAWALVYVVDGLLVTTFSVSSAAQILEEWDAEPDRPRWNAVR